MSANSRPAGHGQWQWSPSLMSYYYIDERTQEYVLPNERRLSQAQVAQMAANNSRAAAAIANGHLLNSPEQQSRPGTGTATSQAGAANHEAGPVMPPPTPYSSSVSVPGIGHSTSAWPAMAPSTPRFSSPLRVPGMCSPPQSQAQKLGSNVTTNLGSSSSIQTHNSNPPASDHSQSSNTFIWAGARLLREGYEPERARHISNLCTGLVERGYARERAFNAAKALFLELEANQDASDTDSTGHHSGED